MIRTDVPVMHCDECEHEWIQRVEEGLPTRCPSRKCRSRLWNENARELPKAAQAGKVEKPPVRAVSNLVERQVPAVVEEYVEPCRYTEYDTDAGETYGCSLPLGHRVKHRRGEKL